MGERVGSGRGSELDSSVCNSSGVPGIGTNMLIVTSSG